MEYNIEMGDMLQGSEGFEWELQSQIDPSDIKICKRPDGSDWVLGIGSFGKVRVSQQMLQLDQKCSVPSHCRLSVLFYFIAALY